MIKDIRLIDSVITELNVEGRADLIKSALNKDVNSSLVDVDFKDKQSKSSERFEKAKVKFDEEEAIFRQSEQKNAKEVLEKHIKTISSKLESLGF
jgi:uncharacterized membrane protein